MKNQYHGGMIQYSRCCVIQEDCTEIFVGRIDCRFRKQTSSKLKTTGAGESLWIWICTTEAAVEGHRLLAATHLEDVVAE